jgi:hypothetical protein
MEEYRKQQHKRWIQFAGETEIKEPSNKERKIIEKDETVDLTGKRISIEVNVW